jgi:hypothetical protein
VTVVVREHVSGPEQCVWSLGFGFEKAGARDHPAYLEYAAFIQAGRGGVNRFFSRDRL